MEKEKQTQAYGIWGMATGILSLLLFLAPYFALPLGIGAIILSTIQMRKGNTGFAIAGLITGILGILIGIFLGLLMIVAIAYNPSLMKL